jgi:hypothetical protein
MQAESAWERKLVGLMLATAGFIAVTFLVETAAAWKNYHQIDPTAGVWTAAAVDARQGMLYRPIVSDIGYGGSRYAPLHIVLQAGLMRLGMGPVASGYALDAFGIALVLEGLYLLMRHLNVAALSAAAMVCFVLATYCYCATAGGIKGDLLPVGLNLWGLTAVLRAVRGVRIMLLVAAICFVLAIATKLTSVFGIASAALWLILRRDWTRAAFLTVAWAVGIILAALATQWASQGRALPILRLCASGGGGWQQLLHAPQRFLEQAIHADRVSLLFWLIAAGLVLIRRAWSSLPVILFIVTSFGTLLIFGSPGTNVNHLVDLDAAAVLVMATQFNSSRAGRTVALTAIVIVAVASVHHLWHTVDIMREARHSQMLAALAETHRSPIDGPLLSENPLLPILEGDRPYMLDSFMFRTARMQRPRIADKFWKDLSERRFRAVILNSPPSEKSYRTNGGDFGPGFIEALGKNYALDGVHGEYFVYLPKPVPRSH